MGSFNFFSRTDVPSTPMFPLDLWFAAPYGENGGDVVCSGREEGFCVLKTKTVKSFLFSCVSKKIFFYRKSVEQKGCLTCRPSLLDT